MNIEKAKWIWLHGNDSEDEYGEFFDSFDYTGGRASLGISCDGNYALYINDREYTNAGLAGFGQYADFPWYKVYDEIDITEYLVHGKNEFRIVVWHYGADFTSGYYKAPPCLLYEVQAGDRAVAYSSDKTMCCEAAGYVSGYKKKITLQLGYSFKYDLRIRKRELNGAFVKNEINYKLNARPIKRLELAPLMSGRLIDKEKRIYDLWRESAGLLYIRLKAPVGEVVTISYGEHISDGEVRRKVGERDFSVELVGSGRIEEYFNPFRRLGCRYLQVEASEKTVVEEIGLQEVLYPLTETPYKGDNLLRQRVYDTSVRTLRLCMHEHYEDTPWREQALYALDSRNQMLFGSLAFEDGLEFQRASLKLMAEDRREETLLSICAPCSAKTIIPSFSLWFVIAMCEYAQRSNDVTLAAEYFEKLTKIIEVFSERVENGLVRNFSGLGGVYWDFYEWSEGLGGSVAHKLDAALQFILSLALQNMSLLCGLLGKTDCERAYAAQAEALNTAANAKYWRSARGLYDTYGDGKHYSELVNALAILCGAAKGRDYKICNALTKEDNLVVKSTLSMKCFTYDALIKTDKDKFTEYILADIDKRYERMLVAGATSFWETEEGERAFNGAGSLCHGWSAAPAYYYRILTQGKKGRTEDKTPYSFYSSGADKRVTNSLDQIWVESAFWPPNYFVKTSFHEVIEIIVVESGKAKAIVNGEERILTDGDSVITNPFDLHSFVNYKHETKIYFFQLGKRNIGKLMGSNDKIFNPFSQNRTDEAVEELMLCAKKIAACHRSMNTVKLSGYLGLLIGCLLDIHGVQNKGNIKRDDLMLKILTYFDENFAERLTLQKVAADLGYHPVYFSRIFNKYIGMSFNDYLNRLRIDKIQEELSKGKASVTNTVHKFGFTNMKTYYNALKKFRKQKNERQSET